MKNRIILTFFLMFFAFGSNYANSSGSVIPMAEKGSATYYVRGQLPGIDNTQFMVDTGSSYMMINEESLAILKENDAAVYVKDLVGKLADGSHKVVPVWNITKITIGEHCVLHNVEAAVFPGNIRQILGLTALKKAGPFAFSFDPPQLTLSHCDDNTAV